MDKRAKARPSGLSFFTAVMTKCRPFLFLPSVLFLLLNPVWCRVARAGLAPGDYSFSLTSDHRRTYMVHRPPRADGLEALPVVLNFHGAMSNGKQQEAYSGMDRTADRFGFIVVYPNGTGRFGHLTWNAGLCCGYAMFHREDDVRFVLALIDDLASHTPIDRSRVYATGLSNGAMMSYRLAAEAADHFAAIAPVAGAMVLPEFHPTKPISIMHIHSVDDPFAAYSGGYGRSGRRGRKLGNPDVETMLAHWRKFDGCPADPKIDASLSGARDSADAGNSATRYTWAPCARGTEIVLWKLAGAGHVWPGAGAHPRLLGRPTNLINANEEIWRFLSRFSRPQN
jgi:polyhydroxybutyrate depolymerase